MSRKALGGQVWSGFCRGAPARPLEDLRSAENVFLLPQKSEAITMIVKDPSTLLEALKQKHTLTDTHLHGPGGGRKGHYGGRDQGVGLLQRVKPGRPDGQSYGPDRGTGREHLPKPLAPPEEGVHL